MAGTNDGKGDDSSDPTAKGKVKNTHKIILDHPKGSSRIVNEVISGKLQIRRIKSGISNIITNGDFQIKQIKNYLAKNMSHELIQGHLSL